MIPLTGILESALYVEDLDRAMRFYQAIFGFELMVSDERRLRALNVAGRQVLLLFKKRASLDHAEPHDGDGQLHLAFAIPADARDAWEQRLMDHGIAIESRRAWPRGGHSLYFRDPDGHLLELVTPGCWANY